MTPDPFATVAALHECAFQHSSLGIVLSGLDGRVLCANVAACLILGHSEEELQRHDLQAITHPDDREVDVTGLQDLLAGTTESFTVQKRYLRRDGSEVTVCQVVCTVRDEEQRPRLFVSQFRDVTAEHRAERQNDALFRLSPDMLAVTSAEAFRLDRINPAWRRTLGWSDEELAERPYLDFIHPEDRERTAAALGQLSQEKPVRSFRSRFLCSNGLYCWLEWNTYVRDGCCYCVVRDVSYQQVAEEELRRLNQRLIEKEAQISSVVDNIGDGLITFDSRGIIRTFNVAAAEMFGYRQEQIIGGHIRSLVPEDLREAQSAEITAHLRGEEPRLVGKGKAVVAGLRKDGSVFDAELVLNAVHTAEGELFIVVLRDVTERRRAEVELFKEKEWLRVTLNSIGDGVISTDTEGLVTYLNPVAEKMTGWTARDAIGQPLTRVFVVSDETTHEPAPNPVEVVLREGRETGLAENSILERRGGGRFAIEDSAAPIRDVQDDIIGVVLVFHDVSDARRLAAEMTHQASHDPLTGLLNRRGFERRLDAVLKQAEREARSSTVLFLDLDQFKVVNDASGHAAGDELLRQLAASLPKRLRHADTLARLGGDEFGVILENCTSDAAMRIAESLRQAITYFPFVWEGRTFHVGVSIGMVSVDDGANTREEVLRQADAACYLAKDRGRNRIHVYKSDDKHRTARQGEMGWVARIHQALDEDRFVLCRQANVALSGGQPAHFEALLRMLEPDGRLVLPMTFLPSAERYGLMPDIDRWVINAALTKLATDRDCTVCFINLSGASVGDETLTDFVRSRVEATGVDASELCFEITETVAIANLMHAEAMIKDLKQLGCRFALDDFGAGMSSFAYLKHLPVDYLKIDGTFVKHMDRDPIDQAMVAAINHIGHVMGIETIAEYVENQATVDLLASMGVNYAQGYWIGRPQPWH